MAGLPAIYENQSLFNILGIDDDEIVLVVLSRLLVVSLVRAF